MLSIPEFYESCRDCLIDNIRYEIRLWAPEVTFTDLTATTDGVVLHTQEVLLQQWLSKAPKVQVKADFIEALLEKFPFAQRDEKLSNLLRDETPPELASK